MPAGSLVGALLVTLLADRLGRKKTVILAGMVWVVGSILQCASVNRGMLVIGRIISGISVGLSSAVVPIYQSEITPPSIRGRMVSLQQWSITWGILIQYFIQFGCSYIDGVASFRIPWGLQMIPAIILSLGMTIFPESPRWLFDKGREEEALQVLADLHGRGDKTDELVVLEYEEIKQQVYFERTEGAKSYLDLLKPGNPRRVMLGCCLQMWSQLTGMNVMMYYIIYVFRGAGLTGTRGNLIADSVQYVLNVAFTVPAIIYIDKWGRRPMLVIGTLLMGFWLCLAVLRAARIGDIDNRRLQVDSWRSLYAFVGSSISLHPTTGIKDLDVTISYPTSVDSSSTSLHPATGTKELGVPIEFSHPADDVVDEIIRSELFETACTAIVSHQWWLFEVSGRWTSTFVKLFRLRPHDSVWKKLVKVVRDANNPGNEGMSEILYQLKGALPRRQSDDFREEDLNDDIIVDSTVNVQQRQRFDPRSTIPPKTIAVTKDDAYSEL
ncbi:hypothetical protein C0995_009714 [Termitomyces sp. Mi166|nr:hypothetical protein C0995_009714 [Termitomyces sp. Mi166\